MDNPILLERWFRLQCTRWQAATAHLSNIYEIMDHSAYRELVSKGSVIIPYILKEIQKTPQIKWFMLLHDITGQYPVIPNTWRGNVQQIAVRWLVWAEENGYMPVSS